MLAGGIWRTESLVLLDLFPDLIEDDDELGGWAAWEGSGPASEPAGFGLSLLEQLAPIEEPHPAHADEPLSVRFQRMACSHLLSCIDVSRTARSQLESVTATLDSSQALSKLADQLRGSLGSFRTDTDPYEPASPVEEASE